MVIHCQKQCTEPKPFVKREAPPLGFFKKITPGFYHLETRAYNVASNYDKNNYRNVSLCIH